jgi:septum formation protein
MFTACCPLILASSSPRRQEFLSELGLQYQTIPAVIDETPAGFELPEHFARRMAEAKTGLIANAHPDVCVIGADTVVALDSFIFGKPRDQADALTILKALQGRTHQVVTAFAVFFKQQMIEEVQSCTTNVTFDKFPDSILKAYIHSGDPMDKAGAYGIQGKGNFLVRSIDGSCSNVIGLPVNALMQVLLKHHLIQPE